VGYLKTILTYNLPSEAEVDRAFLESRGIAVCLLNANTSRNELGAPFFVQLQVMDEDVENACRLINAMNPQRFGSIARVNEIDRQIRRAIARIGFIAVPVGIAVGMATYFLTPSPAHPPTMYRRRHLVIFDVRVELAIAAGVAAGVAAAVLDGRRRTKGPNPPPDPAPGKVPPDREQDPPLG
jgi:hypothetical protein